VVEVYLYGSLRHYASEARPNRESVVRLDVEPGETVGTLLDCLGVPPAEVCHVFLNGQLLSTRNSMAPWLGYQQVQDGLLDQDPEVSVPVRDGDRLGLFARDMALLVV